MRTAESFYEDWYQWTDLSSIKQKTKQICQKKNMIAASTLKILRRKCHLQDWMKMGLVICGWDDCCEYIECKSYSFLSSFYIFFLGMIVDSVHFSSPDKLLLKLWLQNIYKIKQFLKFGNLWKPKCFGPIFFLNS